MRASQITAIDFFEDLTSTYARRRFLGVFVGLIAICLLLIYVTDGLQKDIITSVLVEIMSGSLIILAFYALYVYFIGANSGLRDVTVVRPQDIRHKMLELPKGVRNYMFWGRSGSFFRSYPLLGLDRQAKANGHNVSIDVLLPNPMEDSLVSSYQDILKSLGEDYGDDALLPHVIATCMACAIVSANNRHLEIRIHLSRFLPGFRLDLSDNGAILTQDSKIKSALYFERNSEFYEMFRSTMIGERDVSFEVQWDEGLFRDLELLEDSCTEETLNAFGIAIPTSRDIKEEVAKLVSERPHRYQ
ncbi:MAG: hypothetical protein F4X40_09105 [Chloroflexi bacterium]|nr:hypothetical protein [Chloroflexota bacterium]